MDPASSRDVEEYVEYMRRAADADVETWESMKKEADRNTVTTPSVARLHIGFLLTSPNTEMSNVEAGEKILRSVLVEQTGLDVSVRHLIELRLMEVDTRQALQARVKDVERKIEELMSIESSAEEQELKSQRSPR